MNYGLFGITVGRHLLDISVSNFISNWSFLSHRRCVMCSIFHHPGKVQNTQIYGTSISVNFQLWIIAFGKIEIMFYF